MLRTNSLNIYIYIYLLVPHAYGRRSNRLLLDTAEARGGASAYEDDMDNRSAFAGRTRI